MQNSRLRPGAGLPDRHFKRQISQFWHFVEQLRISKLNLTDFLFGIILAFF